MYLLYMMLKCPLMRCAWRSVGINQLRRQSGSFEMVTECSPLKAFNGHHLIHQKYVSCFSVQTSITGLFSHEFRRNYAKNKKMSGTSADQVSDEEEDDINEDDDCQNEIDQGYKTVTKSVPSLRLDSILKTGLGTSKSFEEQPISLVLHRNWAVSRNLFLASPCEVRETDCFLRLKRTVEKDFYAGKLRINGEKVAKKSILVHESDEIDVVKELFPENEDFLVVNRVIVKSIGNITPGAQFPVKLHVLKALIIENYEDKWP